MVEFSIEDLSIDALLLGMWKIWTNIQDGYIKKFENEFQNALNLLNGLLTENQDEKAVKIVQKITKINYKKYLSVSEFAEKYGVSKASQQQYRSRLYNALPYHQNVAGGKITYNVEEVEKWFLNQHK